MTDTPPQKTIIGLDVGGTKTAIVEGTFEAQILQRTEVATQASRPFAETFPALAALIEQTMFRATQAGRMPAAISVSIGGPLRIREGVLLNPPHLTGWHHIRLKDCLCERFPALPVYIEHDGNAGALAEFYFGAGRAFPNLQHMIFLTFGTGLGAGLIVNGNIVHGASDTAGEVGHIRLAPYGPVGYGKAGSWEGFASGAGLLELASQMFPQRWQANLPLQELVQAMLNDDPEALLVAQESGRWMGRGIAILVDTLNPQLIVVGTLAVVLGDRILQPLRQSLNEEALPTAASHCKIVPAVLGKRIGDAASLMAAIQQP